MQGIRDHTSSRTISASSCTVIGVPEAWGYLKKKEKSKRHVYCHLLSLNSTKTVGDLREAKKSHELDTCRTWWITGGRMWLESTGSSTACGSWLASCHSHGFGWACAKPSVWNLEMNCLSCVLSLDCHISSEQLVLSAEWAPCRIMLMFLLLSLRKEKMKGQLL